MKEEKKHETQMSGMQEEERSAGKQRRKRTTGTLVAVLALLLLLTGTFAWYYTTNAINEFGGKREDANSSAVLHDDFHEQGEEINGALVHNKDVYVENTGEKDLYVRIRLDEYMEINRVSLVSGADKMDEDTWETHIPGTDPADPADKSKDPFHDYWEWKLGGKTEYVPNAEGARGVVSRYDRNGDDTLTVGDSSNKTTITDANGNATTVITMATYVGYTDNAKEAFIGWVYDTDGYAYWSQKLAPEKATGLLLDQVTLTGTIADGDEYYYAINVVLETVDEDDLIAWLSSGVTEDGDSTAVATNNASNELLKLLSDKYTKITDDMKAADPDITDYDYDGDGYLNEEELADYEETNGLKAISAKMTSDYYVEDYELVASDFEVEIEYENGVTVALTSGYTWTPATLSAGTNTIEVSYGTRGKTVTDTVTVEAAVKTLNSIQITTPPDKLVYTAGESFDPTGMVVRANYNNGNSDEDIKDYTYSPSGALSEGTRNVTISYSHNGGTTRSAQVAITVNGAQSTEQELIDQSEVFDEVTIDGREWIILDKDASTGTAELLSKNIVASRQYHSTNTVGEWEWATSDVRAWLQGDFYDSLGQDLQNMIVTVMKDVSMPGSSVGTWDGGPNAETVYLLSNTEYRAYASAYPGNLYEARGESGVNSTGYWWLRTPYSTIYPYVVSTYTGNVGAYGTASDIRSIRPALTVAYK